jgi:hypothetical protein
MTAACYKHLSKNTIVIMSAQNKKATPNTRKGPVKNGKGPARVNKTAQRASPPAPAAARAAKTYTPPMPNITTLGKLLAHLRARGLTRYDYAMSALARCVGDDVTIVYEVVGAVESGKQYPSNETSLGQYAHLADKQVGRVLLSAKRKEADFSSVLYRQLNGIVLECNTWKVLAVPSCSFFRNASPQNIVANIASYDIYEIIDGTVVTLYHYNGSWRLSSANGYDVSQYTWLVEKTYWDAIADLATRYPEFKFENLSKRTCYTIGFRHKWFHPLMSDPERLWLIQACNLDVADNVLIADGDSVVPMIIRELNDVGLPVQQPLRTVVTGQDLYNQLTLENESAIQKYTSMLASGAAVPHYGYFMRSRSTASSLCDLMLPSNLLLMLQRTIYDLPRKRKPHESPITHQNRLNYVTLRAYLSVFTKFEFITMFPQFSQTYEHFDIMFNKLTNRVIALTTEGPSPTPLQDSRLESLARKLADYINKTPACVQSPDGAAVVQDFMRDKRFLELFFTAFVAVP